MARLDGGRFNRWVEKFFNIKQAGASVTGVEDSIRPVAPLFLGQEDRYIQGWNRFAVTTTAPAVAANTTAVEILNPVGSGIIAVIEKLNALPGAVELCQWALQPLATSLTTAVPLTISRLDGRGNKNAVCQISQGTTPIPGAGGLPAFRMLATTTGNTEFVATINQEPILMPGDGLLVIGELVNTQLSVAFMWRERVLESSELT